MILDKCPDVSGLKGIGYWKSEYEPELPNTHDFVDHSWTGDERKMVMDYLSGGEVIMRFRGMSRCRVCGEFNGSTTMSDGTYAWPQGFQHYLLEHGVRPPQEFVDHVREKVQEKRSSV